MEKIVEGLTLNQYFQFAIQKDKKKKFVNFDGKKQSKNTLKQTAVLSRSLLILDLKQSRVGVSHLLL